MQEDNQLCQVRRLFILECRIGNVTCCVASEEEEEDEEELSEYEEPPAKPVAKAANAKTTKAVAKESKSNKPASTTKPVKITKPDARRQPAMPGKTFIILECRIGNVTCCIASEAEEKVSDEEPFHQRAKQKNFNVKLEPGMRNNPYGAYQHADYHDEREDAELMWRGRHSSVKRPRETPYVCWVDDYANASFKMETVESHHHQRFLERQMAAFEDQSSRNHQRQLELIRAQKY